LSTFFRSIEIRLLSRSSKPTIAYLVPALPSNAVRALVAVTRQQMSSLDAKVEWQKQFLEMKRMKEQEVGLALQAISAMPQPS
jgi:hypothetical protein